MAENNTNLLFTGTMNADMAQLAKSRKTFLNSKGGYDAAAWLEFATQFNAYLGHVRRPFTPITGKNFKL